MAERPILLCGLGRVGWRVLDFLRTIGYPVVVIDSETDPDDARLKGVRLIKGDCRRPEVLQDAGVLRARGVLILTSVDLVNISATLMVRHLNPEVRVVMRMFNQNLITRLGKAVNNVFALSTSTLAAPILALAALTGQALGTFRIEGVADGRRQVAEVVVGHASPLRGLTLHEASQRYDFQTLTHFPTGASPRFLLDLDPATVIRGGDRLVACGDPRALAPHIGQVSEQEAGSAWIGWLRRYGKMVGRTLAEIDTALKVCTAILLLVIVVSTVVFTETTDPKGLADGFYRTINLITSGADMALDENQPAWIKVYVSGLRLMGTALIAAFTAIVTNYLLRARLGGALEVRKIPETGHVVVCGLGNVGFRVVEELVNYGERVVVLELARDSRFVTTARRLGVPVIHGDATVREVLRQANAATARAVIAVTSNDLANLEVALMVREMNEEQRVVLRLTDPTLAQTLREAANIRFALSVPALAAPAFLASLLGDRVQSVFLVGERLMVVMDLLMEPEDVNLIDQTVRAVAVDYRLLPIALRDPEGRLVRQPLTARLTAGCRLCAVMMLPDLERFVGRQPVPRNFAVDVTSFTLPAKEWVTLLLRTQRGLGQEEAEEALGQLPVCMGEHLTRGQAEDLLALLSRERVSGRLRVLS